MKVRYLIDGEETIVAHDDATTFEFGEKTFLWRDFRDLTADCQWFERGYTVRDLLNRSEMAQVSRELSRIVKSMLRKQSIDVSDFSLERYHRFVDDALHYQVIEHTRRLFPDHFGMNVRDTVEKISDVTGSQLSFFDPVAKREQWMICRINRPGSLDFNPAHKDIYASYDRFGMIPRMVNCWIPVCGVSGRTGLPLAPGSHLLSEAEILRTRAGSKVNGVAYSVNSIARWGDDNSLTTITPGSGEALMFSSHLIHGLARNRTSDTTRVSFEFRLYG